MQDAQAPACRRCGTPRVAGKRCRPCAAASSGKWRLSHPDKARAATQKYRAGNKDKVAASRQKWGSQNREYLRDRQREWSRANPDRKSEYNRSAGERGKRRFDDGEKARAESKRCPLCETTKVASEFYLSNTNKDGLHGWCKDCSDRRTVQNQRRSKYGVGPEEYAALLASQDSKCAICRTVQPGYGRAEFALDHDHATGRVRGILCHPCNRMLGMARDNTDVLRAAAAYLEG